MQTNAFFCTVLVTAVLRFTGHITVAGRDKQASPSTVSGQVKNISDHPISATQNT